MGKSKRDISFKKFMESVKAAKLSDMSPKGARAMKHADIKVKSKDNFQAMRAHLLKQYADAAVAKSFEDHNGQIWDCIAVDKQGVKAPDISSKILRKPDTKKETKLATSFLSKRKKDKNGNQLYCPEGCIPVRRVQLEEMMKYESLQNFFKKTPRRHVTSANQPVKPKGSLELHKYAFGTQLMDNTGGHSLLSINSPAVGLDEIFSLSQHWYSAGLGESLQTVEAGWQVYPGKWGTSEPCLFIYYTADNYHSDNGYNLEANAFQQYNNNWALGGPLTGTELEITWALVDGKWWLYLNGDTEEHAVGYYPIEIFRGGPMSINATQIDYGGEAVGTNSWPQMGNGQFPDSGASAYQRNIKYFDMQGGGNWAILNPSQNFSNCFKIELSANDDWGTFFHYGGPGGSNC